jgi:hypothetical protein
MREHVRRLIGVAATTALVAATLVVAPARAQEPASATGSTTTLSASATVQRYGAAAAKRITLTARITATTEPLGTVTFSTPAGVLATRPVRDKVARLRLPRATAVDRYRVTATYSGSVEVLASTSSPVRVKVKAAKPLLTLAASSFVQHRGKKPVRITAELVRPKAPVTGKVVFRVNRTKHRIRVDDKSRAKLALPRMLPHGVHRVTARYGGDANVSASKLRKILVVVVG